MNFIVQTVLSQKYSLVAVPDVFQGMNELKRNEIELIIIDIDYHTQENWDFIQHIKTSGFYMHTPVVILTSNGNWQNEVAGDCEVDGCFYKPFSPQDMASNIDELMERNFAKLRSINL